MNGEPDDPSAEHEERLNDILAEYFRAAEAGQAPDTDAFVARYPDFAGELEVFFADRERFERMAETFKPACGAATPPSELATHVQAPDDATRVPDSAPKPAPPPGTKLRYFGDYELLDEIARGGMGVVYRARQVSLNRVVALKMILAGELASEEDIQRFQTEAEAAANLQHPNIVAIHEVGEHEGQHYFSMDYVEGTSLAEMVRENPLPAKQAAGYVKAIAEAIHYAHEQGTLHRDLKPSNVLIDASDEPRVTDFGLAKRIAGDSNLTVSGTVLGTPSYMPPEQASGSQAEVGPVSDVYSLGAILYELLTGRPPFRAETAFDTIVQVIEAEPVSPRLLNPMVPRDLEVVCLKCLRKDPQKRYASAKELAEDVDRFLHGKPVLAPSSKSWMPGEACTWRTCTWRNRAGSAGTWLACWSCSRPSGQGPAKTICAGSSGSLSGASPTWSA